MFLEMRKISSLWKQTLKF